MAKKQTKTNPEVELAEVEAPINEEVTSTTGTVDNCFRLNIRKKPSVESDVLSVVNVNSTLTIDNSKSNKDWYFVTDAEGNSGYCMKQYVTVN